VLRPESCELWPLFELGSEERVDLSCFGASFEGDSPRKMRAPPMPSMMRRGTSRLLVPAAGGGADGPLLFS
jgi:hypothetical protein